MYSTHNEEKSALADRFIRTLKKKIYKHMTDVSQNVYVDKLDNIINEYNNTYHRTIKMTLLMMLMIKILNLKLVIMLEYQNTKTLLLKDIL